MGATQNIVVPDIGGSSDVDVIELLVKPGDRIDIETPLITLESDKATMDIPSPAAGVVAALKVKVGDKVSEGDLILVMEGQSGETAVSEKPAVQVADTPEAPPAPASQTVAVILEEAKIKTTDTPPSLAEFVSKPTNELILAGPAARRLARVLGVALEDVAGSGRKARISKEDIEAFVKQRLAGMSTSGQTGFVLPKAKPIDFSKFGDIETKPLSKIKKLTGANVHQSWITVPMVTQFDSADITELEAFRKSESSRAERDGYKLTILAFVCKAVYQALVTFPQFNSSLDASGEQLIYKKYFNIGIAVETPNGLVVAVIKEVDKLSISGIAREMARLSSKARDKGLTPAEMSGSCFTISSLGGIGGHAFTPIVNPPEVAILGLSRASTQPVYQNNAFVPRLVLPLSLTYDHRVIDGAEAARFSRYLGDALSDIRRILL
jgi:pyruvate dehydrogenase E2 component (dihydrolipoamide acetyltransferase)